MAPESVDAPPGLNVDLAAAAKDGAKVGYTFNQALLDYDCFAMPKGAPNKDVAMKFLAEISKAEYQANLPFHITYGPTNKKAYEVTTAPKELLEALPSHPKNVPMMMPVSLDWYAKHRTEALELYNSTVYRGDNFMRFATMVSDVRFICPLQELAMVRRPNVI